MVLVVKNPPPASSGDIRDLGSIPGSRSFPGGGCGNLSQYSCLENSMDREEPGGLQSMGSQRVGHDLASKQHEMQRMLKDVLASFIPDSAIP